MVEGKSEPHKANNENKYRTGKPVVTATETNNQPLAGEVKRANLLWKSRDGALT